MICFSSTITVPFYGKLSDLYGRKPLLIIGITTFLVGSALSGLSQTMWQLILFRGIQGVGAGSLFPIALAVIGDLFTLFLILVMMAVMDWRLTLVACGVIPGV